MRKPGRPGLSEAQVEHVRSTLARVRDEHFAGNATATAKALGFTQSGVSQILARKNRPSYALAEALAAFLRVSAAEVLSGAAIEAPPRSVVPDRYPERSAALLRLRGLLPPDVEERLRSVVVHEGEPLTEIDWIELALMRLHEHHRVTALARRTGA
jgi:transcriptional regulator with XRE-family HTH domain